MQRLLLWIVLLLSFSPSLRAGQLEVEGYEAPSVAVATQGAFLGGFDILPNGHYAIFDGAAVIEVDAVTGQTLGTLFTPATSVFGSFVRVAPDHLSFFFGESSNGVIFRVPIAGGTGTPAATIAFNYDMEFDPFGRAFVSAASGAFGENFVHLVDLTTGQTDEIVNVPSFSGPLSFDGQGNLYLGQPDDQFPPRTGMSRVLFFTKAQVDSAIGPTVLGQSDSQDYADQLDAIFDMDFDAEGDLFITDGFNGTVTEFSSVGTKTEVLNGLGGSIYTFTRFAQGTAGLFEPFQPSSGGRLATIEFVFSGQNEAVALRPRRPEAATNPASPIPPGPFTFSVTEAPAHGAGVLLIADDVIDPELPLFVNGVPLFIGLDLGRFRLLLPVTFDGTGTLSVATSNPGLGGVSLAVQAIAGHSLSQLLGTSNALLLTLD